MADPKDPWRCVFQELGWCICQKTRTVAGIDYYEVRCCGFDACELERKRERTEETR